MAGSPPESTVHLVQTGASRRQVRLLLMQASVAHLAEVADLVQRLDEERRGSASRRFGAVHGSIHDKVHADVLAIEIGLDGRQDERTKLVELSWYIQAEPFRLAAARV